MVNAWSLLYEELNETMDEVYPVMTDNTITPQESDEYDPKPESNSVTPQESDEYDPIIKLSDTVEHSDAWYDYTRNDPNRENPFTDPEDRARAERVVGNGNTASAVIDHTYTITGTDIGDITINTDEIDQLDITLPPTPGIKDPSNRKYKEDESIKALQDYISTTYGGHYTSDNNNVQTLDLIESVGDAEAFCRSNAIKYLSRYDKKGQAKRDILKALHYSLLLYHFSGQLNETPTRGYETF